MKGIEMSEKTIVSINKFCKWYPISKVEIRWMIKQKNSSPYAHAFICEGKRILIDVDEFWKCHVIWRAKL